MKITLLSRSQGTLMLLMCLLILVCVNRPHEEITDGKKCSRDLNSAFCQELLCTQSSTRTQRSSQSTDGFNSVIE